MHACRARDLKEGGANFGNMPQHFSVRMDPTRNSGPDIAGIGVLGCEYGLRFCSIHVLPFVCLTACLVCLDWF